jgi:hypothetical protein
MTETYPQMFSKSYGGFAIGSGWWQIIDSLCDNIQSYIDWQKTHDPVVQVTVDQVKEKFGGLRFYYQGGDSHIAGMVRMTESWASHSCETCGAPGKRRSGGYIRTLCDVHEAERSKVNPL